MDPNRRRFLVLAGLAPLALAAAARARAAGAAACYDPNALPLSQKSRRRSMNYVELSADPGKRCGLCAFYTPGQGDCGACQLLSGGPVGAAANCSSFAARAKQ